MKVSEIRKVQVGQWVRTKWDDCGGLDTLVTDKRSRGSDNRPYFIGYFPSTGNSQSFEGDQITAIGKHVTCKDNGL